MGANPASILWRSPVHLNVLAPKLLTPALALCLLLGGVASQVVAPVPAAQANTKAKQSVWNAVDVTDGGFTVLLPGIVDRQVNAPQIMGQSVEQTLLVATQEQHDAFYLVAWSDLSVGDRLDEAGQTQVLDLARDSFLRSFKGRLTNETKLRLGGNPGKQFTMISTMGSQTFVVRSRSFLVGSRLYHVLAAVPQRLDANLVGSTNGFLKSFQLQPGFTPANNVAQHDRAAAAEPDSREAITLPLQGAEAQAADLEAKAEADAADALKRRPLVTDPAARRLF